MNKQREGSNHLKTHNTVAIRLDGLSTQKMKIYTHTYILYNIIHAKNQQRFVISSLYPLCQHHEA